MSDLVCNSPRTICECTVRCKGVALSLCVIRAAECRSGGSVKRPLLNAGTTTTGTSLPSAATPASSANASMREAEWIVLVGSQGPKRGGRISVFALREESTAPASTTLKSVLTIPLDAPPTAFAPFKVSLSTCSVASHLIWK